jgi:hypothetical protein
LRGREECWRREIPRLCGIGIGRFGIGEKHCMVCTDELNYGAAEL